MHYPILTSNFQLLTSKLGIAVVLLVLTSAMPSAAQFPTPEDMGRNYSFNVGAAILPNSLQDTSAVMIGISWFEPAGAEFGQDVVLGLTGDWLEVHRTDGQNVQLVPLLFNYRQYGIISNWRVFFNLGVGMLATTDAIPEMKLQNGSNFGWTGGFGFDVSNSLSFQARFVGGKNPSDDGLVSFQLGYRF